MGGGPREAGLAAGAIVRGGSALIQRLYFLDRDAQQGPLPRPPPTHQPQSFRPHIHNPFRAESPLIIPADTMREGAMADCVAAVCRLTCRLAALLLFFPSGLVRRLILMYNLLLILLTLKGEHVDRDLTCEGSDRI